jgi:pimeloyl-ACP methyl ester carboxylesterase
MHGNTMNVYTGAPRFLPPYLTGLGYACLAYNRRGQITCPSLYLRGDQEDPEVYPAEEFARRAAAPCTVVILDRCDHFYRGCEDAVAHTVVKWLRATLGA